MDSLFIIFYATMSLLVAGTVKGAVGLGLPTTALGLLTLAIDPRAAIAMVLIPMMTTNLWQVYRQGEVLRALRTYAPFGLALAVGVAVTLVLTRDAPDRLLFGTLGGAILIFVALSVTRWKPSLPDRWDNAGQVGFGLVGGALGGLTSVWAPPMAIYLAARKTPKAEFVRACGLLIFCGSIPLALGYVASGFMTAKTALVSFGLLVPTLLGFAFGERLRNHLSEEAFRRWLLGVFFLMGLNLLRRAAF
ncbi:MAG: sulfite exporter TauE/SafE family protein [Acuticoccus sp.]